MPQFLKKFEKSNKSSLRYVCLNIIFYNESI